jgi:putative hemolysin
VSAPNNDHLKIDLEKIISSKNPALLKLLPAFVLRYMKRVVHEKEFNEFLLNAKDAYAHDFVGAAVDNFQINISSEGLENIPVYGGCIVVCNHPLGGLDGIAVMNEVGKVRKDIKALVNDILMRLDNLAGLLVPVNKHGKNPTNNMRLINNAYASEECLIVFPAGLVSRVQNGKVEDQAWSRSFISKAVRQQHPVIPVFVDAYNSKFFYALAFLRKKAGIKANLEMFYLVDEAYRQRGKSIRLIVGKPIPSATFTKNHSDQYWANKVRSHVYALKDGKSLM